MCAVPSMTVFCISLTSWFPGMSLTYFLNDLEMVPVAPIITGITLAFTFHMHSVSLVRSIYFKIFSASFSITFLSPEIATAINIHVPFSLSQIIVSGLLLGIVLSVYTCWFHSIVTLPSWFVTTDFGTCSYQCFLSSCSPLFLHMLKCICALTFSCRFTYCSFASIGLADIIWSIVSSSCWHSLHLLSVSVCIVIIIIVVQLGPPLPGVYVYVNTFAASYLNTQGLNNSCLKWPASTLVDLTFQSRALRSFTLNQLRNLSL